MDTIHTHTHTHNYEDTPPGRDQDEITRQASVQHRDGPKRSSTTSALHIVSETGGREDSSGLQPTSTLQGPGLL
eukprot:1359669-Pleurochrysis_carterae.AAC.1